MGWCEWLTGLWRSEDFTPQHRGQISVIENNSGNVLVIQNSVVALGCGRSAGGRSGNLRKTAAKEESPEFS